MKDLQNELCKFCKKSGHSFENCFNRLWLEHHCFKCHKVGHQQKDCWYYGNGNKFVRNRVFRRISEYPGWKQPKMKSSNGYESHKAERFNREGLDRSSKHVADEDKLFNDVKEFHAGTTSNSSHRGSQ